MAATHPDVRPAARPLAAFLPRRAFPRVALTALATLAVVFAPGPAIGQGSAVSVYRGNINFINQTDTTLWIAIYYLDEENCDADGWVTQGWWGVAPGGITAVHQLHEGHNLNYYYYAYGEDGTTFFAGSTTSYIDKDDKYTWCIRPGRSYPGVATVGMRKLEIEGQTTTYIMRLGTDIYVPIAEELPRSVPFEPADSPVLDEEGCWISGGVRQCPAYD